MKSLPKTTLLVVLGAFGLIPLASSCVPTTLERPEAVRARCYAPPGQLPSTFAGKWLFMMSDYRGILRASGVAIVAGSGHAFSIRGNYRWSAPNRKVFRQSKWAGTGKVQGPSLLMTTSLKDKGHQGQLKLELDHGGARLSGTFVENGISYLVVACRVL